MAKIRKNNQNIYIGWNNNRGDELIYAVSPDLKKVRQYMSKFVAVTLTIDTLCISQVRANTFLKEGKLVRDLRKVWKRQGRVPYKYIPLNEGN